jgi:hypothetical protein
LISGFFNFWESENFHRNLQARSAEQYDAQYRGKEYHLLQSLAAFSQDVPNVEMAGGYSSWRGGWIMGWGQRAPGHHYSSVIPNLLIGVQITLTVPFILVGAWRERGTKQVRVAWRHVRACGALAAVVLGGVLPVWALAEFGFLGAGAHAYDYKSIVLKTDIEATTLAIQHWADESGYATGDECNWNLNTVPKGKRVAQARLREAWKPSPFDRWRSTLATFRPISPFLAFELVASDDPAETLVEVSTAWDQRVPRDLLDTLEKLRAATSREPVARANLPGKAK